MGYDGPSVFLAPYGNTAAQENFERTVVDGVDFTVVSEFTDRDFTDDVVRLWGTKASVEGSWKKISPGDFLFFYRDGQYDRAVEVVDTERNEELGRKIWPNHEEDSPWECIIYVKNPVQLNLDSGILHDLAGHDITYVMGFSKLNELGLGGLRGRYGSIENLVYGEGEPVDSVSEPEESDKIRDVPLEEFPIHDEPTFDIPESIFDDLHFQSGQKADIVDQLSAALNAGKHIVFTGPPGTGKTEFARLTAEFLAEEYGRPFTGFQVTTATADWSTFETVGGYMPEEGDGGNLSFEPGQVLRRFKREREQRNELLVIDEINRADIDKAFGQLFTLLSGQPVQLPFKRGGEEIEITPATHVEATETLGRNEYVMPNSWRLFATMNSYDKTSLYEMSYAFMRRFSFIHVDAPDVPEETEAGSALVQAYATSWNIDPEDAVLETMADVWYAANTPLEERKIGPAIVKDILETVTGVPSADRDRAFTHAIANFIFPQLEGVPRRERVVNRLANVDGVDEDRLRALGLDVLQVSVDG